MAITCAIVNKNSTARRSLQQLCDQNEAISVVATCEDATDLLQCLRQKSVDLLLLDIEQRSLTDHLAELPTLPHIRLTTTRTEYAFDAFYYQATDPMRSAVALPRFKLLLDDVQHQLMLSRPHTGTSRSIFVKTNGRYIRIQYDTILFFENTGDFVKIVTPGQTHVVSTTMKALESKLSQQFLRIHRSYIINLEKIINMEEGNLVISNKIIPISRARKSALLNRLNLL